MARDAEPMYSLFMAGLESLEVYNAFKEGNISESVLYSRIKGVERLAKKATREMLEIVGMTEEIGEENNKEGDE